jgi:hypothetical protein
MLPEATKLVLELYGFDGHVVSLAREEHQAHAREGSADERAITQHISIQKGGLPAFDHRLRVLWSCRSHGFRPACPYRRTTDFFDPDAALRARRAVVERDDRAVHS